MNKKTSKFFTMFWFLSGIVWLGVILKHTIINNDITGIVIYIIAALVSFSLALAFCNKKI